MRYPPMIVRCAVGIEDLLIAELAELGCCGRRLHQGYVIVDEGTGPEDLMRVIAYARLSYGVGWHLFSGEVVPDLASIAEQLTAIDLDALPAPPCVSYGVKAERLGAHGFTSVELATTVAGAMGRAFGRAGISGLRAQLVAPEFPIAALLDGHWLIVAVMFSGEASERRCKPPFLHHASLDPSLAAAMLREVSFCERSALLDPMCGGGTILWEAATALAGISPWRFSPVAPSLVRQSWFTESMTERLAALIAAPSLLFAEQRVHRTGPRLLGADRYGGKLAGTRSNLEHFGVAGRIELHLSSAANLSFIAENEVDAIVVNPPYGVRISNPRESDELIRLFARACRTKALAHVVIISPRKGPLLDAFANANFFPLTMRQVMNGEMVTFMIHFVPS